MPYYLSLPLDVQGSPTIAQVIEQGLALAKKIGMPVSFHFSEVYVYLMPGGNKEDAYRLWKGQMDAAGKDDSTVGGGSKLRIERDMLEDLNNKFGFGFDPAMTGLSANSLELILDPPVDEAGGVQTAIELMLGYAPKDWSAKKKAEAVVALALAVKASNLATGSKRMKMKWNEPEGWSDEIKQAIRAIASKG